MQRLKRVVTSAALAAQVASNCCSAAGDGLRAGVGDTGATGASITSRSRARHPATDEYTTLHNRMWLGKSIVAASPPWLRAEPRNDTEVLGWGDFLKSFIPKSKSHLETMLPKGYKQQLDERALVERPCEPSEQPQLMRYEEDEEKGGRLLIAVRMTVRDSATGHEEILITNHQGLWFRKETGELYNSRIRGATSVTYEAHEAAKIKAVGVLKCPPPHFTLREMFHRLVLPAIQNKYHKCGPRAAEYLAIRAGLLGFFRTVRSNWDVEYRGETPDGSKFTVVSQPEASSNGGHNTFQLWAVEGCADRVGLSLSDFKDTFSYRPKQLEPVFDGFGKPTVTLAHKKMPKGLDAPPGCEVLDSSVQWIAPFVVHNGKLWEAMRMNRRLKRGVSKWVKDEWGFWWDIDKKQCTTAEWEGGTVIDKSVQTLARCVGTFNVYPLPQLLPSDWYMALHGALQAYYSGVTDLGIAHFAASCGWFSGLQLRDKQSGEELIVAFGPVNFNLRWPPIVLRRAQDGKVHLVPNPPVMVPENYTISGVCLVHAGPDTPAMKDITNICKECYVDAPQESEQTTLQVACMAVNYGGLGAFAVAAKAAAEDVCEQWSSTPATSRRPSNTSRQCVTGCTSPRQASRTSRSS